MICKTTLFGVKTKLILHNIIKIGFQWCIILEVPQRQTAELIKIIPVPVEFIDMFLPGIIFRILGIIQVECIDFTYQESLDTGFITLLCNLIRFIGNRKLLCLIIKILYKQEDVLIKVNLFLTYFG